MKTTIKGLAIIVAVLALAACGGKTDKAAAPAGSDGTSLAPGVWESTISGEGVPAMTVRTCIDAAHAKPTLGAGSCTDVTRTPTGKIVGGEGAWTIRATCGTAPNGLITMTGEMHGNLNSAYTIDITASAPAGKDAATVTLKVEAKKTAETCPADLPPGAFETPQGIIDSSGVKAAP
jgi:hypothetical protein